MFSGCCLKLQEVCHFLKHLYLNSNYFFHLNFVSKMFQYKFSGKKLDGLSLSLLTIDKYGITPLFFKTSLISEIFYFLNIYPGEKFKTIKKCFPHKVFIILVRYSSSGYISTHCLEEIYFFHWLLNLYIPVVEICECIEKYSKSIRKKCHKGIKQMYLLFGFWNMSLRKNISLPRSAIVLLTKSQAVGKLNQTNHFTIWCTNELHLTSSNNTTISLFLL